MNSHYYRRSNKVTLYQKLREKYTDDEILVLIKRSVETSTSVAKAEHEEVYSDKPLREIQFVPRSGKIPLEDVERAVKTVLNNRGHSSEN